MSKFPINIVAMVWNLKQLVLFADTWGKAGDAIREAFYHRVKYGTQKYDCLYFSAMLKVLTQSFGIDVRYFIQVSYSGLLPFLFLTLFYKIIRQPSYTKNLISFLTSPLEILY